MEQIGHPSQKANIIQIILNYWSGCTDTETKRLFFLFLLLSYVSAR